MNNSHLVYKRACFTLQILKYVLQLLIIVHVLHEPGRVKRRLRIQAQSVIGSIREVVPKKHAQQAPNQNDVTRLFKLSTNLKGSAMPLSGPTLVKLCVFVQLQVRSQLTGHYVICSYPCSDPPCLKVMLHCGEFSNVLVAFELCESKVRLDLHSPRQES